jgi:hypothetical protein
MKKNLLLFSLLSSFAAVGQITITSSDLAVAGQQVFQASDTLPTVSAGGSGPSQTWNMTALGSDYIDTLKFANLSWVPDDTTFPTANFVMQFNSAYQYAYGIRNSTGLSIIGNIAEIDFGTSTVITQRNTPAEQLITFPSSYNTMFSNNYVSDGKFYYGIDPGIGTTVDSVRVKSTIQKTSVADAWGNVTTPLGTYGALRFKEDKMQTDSTFGYISGFGWIYFDSSSDTTRHFSWWANGIGFPVVQVDVDPISGNVTAAQWLQSPPVTGVDQLSSTAVQVFPNPATEQIVFSGLVQDQVLRVFDVTGRIVLVRQISSDQLSVGLDAFAPGIYTYQISEADSMISLGKFTVVK